MANGFSASQVAGAEFASAAAAYGIPNAGEFTALAHLQAVMASVLDVNVLGQVFNVRDPRFAGGAKGDGVTDDTAAIVAAIAAARASVTQASSSPFGVGARVYIPRGIYMVTADIDIPAQVIVFGDGLRITVIRWASSSDPTEAVVTSNLDDRFGFVHSAGLTGMTVDANDSPVGLKIRGWNEGCVLENVEIREYTDPVDGGVQILSSAPGSNTHTTQNVYFRGLWLGGKTGARNLLLDGCNRVTFDNVTVFLANYNAGSNPGPMLTGIELRQVCRQIVFVNPNVEDCTRAYDIGTADVVSGNVFINALMDAPVGAAPADTTIDSDTGTMGFVVRPGAGTLSSPWGCIIGYRDGYGYDWPIYDAALGIIVANGNPSNDSRTFGANPSTRLTPLVHRLISSNTDDTTPSVARGNIINLNNSNPTSVTTFDDGQEGQVLICRFTNSNTTLVDGATLQLAGGVNFVGTSNDTLTLVLVSGVWTEIARSVN